MQCKLRLPLPPAAQAYQVVVLIHQDPESSGLTSPPFTSVRTPSNVLNHVLHAAAVQQLCMFYCKRPEQNWSFEKEGGQLLQSSSAGELGNTADPDTCYHTLAYKVYRCIGFFSLTPGDTVYLCHTPVGIRC